MFAQPRLVPLADRGPLRVLFAINNLDVGGAEMLTYELLRRIDRERFAVELACMSKAGELGEKLRNEIPVHAHFLRKKYDVRVLWRLTRLLRRGRFDAIVTVGAGDRMFWGRVCAGLARTPVIVSALHSTGWPDVVGRLNRLLTPWTDAFVGCAEPHAEYLRDVEKFPADRVHWIPNGVDTQKFHPRAAAEIKAEFHIPGDAPVVGIVAQLRPEKNHELFLEMAAKIVRSQPRTHFVMIGHGPRRAALETLADDLGLAAQTHFLGARPDVPRLLGMFDVFTLTSRIEANPVSILEAQATGVPVVAVRVGSIPSTVIDGQTGYLANPGDGDALADKVVRLLANPALRETLGRQARENVIAHWSLERMVCGYEDLLTNLYEQKPMRATPPADERASLATYAKESPRHSSADVPAQDEMQTSDLA
ncbi:MAG: glycosyltransferase [Pirellulales bacterium]